MEWIWSILELEPTTDRSAIRQAYARKANDCHPDEDSEELLRLKQALQAALDYAKANGRSSGPAFGNEAEPNGTRWPAIAEPPEMGENPFRGGEAIRQFGKPILNVHPSLIPAFCGKGFYGLRVHQAALDYGVKVTGATVHLVNEIPDGGKILLQRAVEVQPGDTAEILQRRVMEQAEWKLLPQAAETIAAEIVRKKENMP